MSKEMRIMIFLITMSVLTGCYQTENGIVFGRPDYEKRDREVTEVDLRILERTDELLTEENWNQSSVRVCSESKDLSLYCALEKASIEINGEYNHRQAALQEVRFAIDDLYKSYWSKHRLGDFNGNNSTTLTDVKKVIALAVERVESKLKHSSLSQQDSR